MRERDRIRQQVIEEESEFKMKHILDAILEEGIFAIIKETFQEESTFIDLQVLQRKSASSSDI